MQSTIPDLKTRDVGEKVSLNLAIDSASTKDLGEGILEAIITTSTKDRHGEEIVTSGISTENYMANNPIVLYGHDYYGLPIGKTLKLIHQKNKIKAQFQLAIDEYPFAKTVNNMIQGGYLNTVSIGGIVKKWSEDYRTIEEMEMVEFSVVPIPANEQAVITSRAFEDAAGKSLDTVKEEYQDFAHKTMLDKVKGLGKDEVKSAISVLTTLLATLKESADATSSAGEAEPAMVKHVKRVRLMAAAKAVNQESERIIRIIKVGVKDVREN